MAQEIMKLSDLDEATSICSIQVTDRESAAKVFNAMNNPEGNLRDYINKTLSIKDVFAEVIDLEAENGELEQAVRVVLIDDKGKAYQAVSKGVFNALKNLMSIPYIGSPTWEPPLKLMVKQEQVARGTMLTLDLVG